MALIPPHVRTRTQREHWDGYPVELGDAWTLRPGDTRTDNVKDGTLELMVRGERVTIYRQNILHITERTRRVTEEIK